MMAIIIITISPVPYIIIIILKAVGWVVIEVRCYFLYFLAEALSHCQPRESAGQTVLVIIIVIIREGVQKNGFFGTLSQTMGRLGSKVPNFLVKTTIQQKNVF